jgi:hypothetical protein
MNKPTIITGSHAGDRHANDRRQAVALGQLAGQLAEAEERGRVQREAETELPRRKPVLLAQHEGRVAEIDEESREAEGADHRKPDEASVLQQVTIGAEGTAPTAAPPGFGWSCLFQREDGQQQRDHRGHSQRPEHTAPADNGDHHASGQRRQDR